MSKYVNLFIALVLGGTLAAYLFLPNQYGGQDLFGAVSYPASLDTFTNPSATDRTNSPSHATQHSNHNDGIEALQAFLGISSSTVSSSVSFKLKDIFGGNKAASLTGTETLTNKTLTSPSITDALITTAGISTLTATNSTMIGTTTLTLNGNPYSLDLGSDATGDIYYRNSSGHFTRLPVGSNNDFLRLSAGIPSWDTVSVGGNAVAVYSVSTTTAGARITTGEIAVDANDELIVWAQIDNTDCDGAATQHETMTLKYNQSSSGATTTIATVTDQSENDGIGCNAVAMGHFTATTSENIIFEADETTAVAEYISLIVQHFIQ